jgi:hypothetical protein
MLCEQHTDENAVADFILMESLMNPQSRAKAAIAFLIN